MEEYTIGEIAKQLGINKETIRYYEKFELLPLPVKRDNGYKIYTKQHVEIMEIILLIKDSGFTLKEIKNIISIQSDNINASNSVYKEIILDKIGLVEKKIADLNNIKKGLEKVVFDIENYNIRSCIEIQKKSKNGID